MKTLAIVFVASAAVVLLTVIGSRRDDHDD